MSGKKQNHDAANSDSLSCAMCQEGLQEYVDGTLGKARSLKFFLHLRHCAACENQRASLVAMFALLEDLPQHEVPLDFDTAILASVPYDSYRAMERLRRERVPVFLEEAFLPKVLRSRTTRWSGLAIAAVATTGAVVGDGSVWWLAAAVAGLVPEALVLLQVGGRRMAVRLKAGS